MTTTLSEAERRTRAMHRMASDYSDLSVQGGGLLWSGALGTIQLHPAAGGLEVLVQAQSQMSTASYRRAVSLTMSIASELGLTSNLYSSNLPILEAMLQRTGLLSNLSGSRSEMRRFNLVGGIDLPAFVAQVEDGDRAADMAKDLIANITGLDSPVVRTLYRQQELGTACMQVPEARFVYWRDPHFIVACNGVFICGQEDPANDYRADGESSLMHAQSKQVFRKGRWHDASLTSQDVELVLRTLTHMQNALQNSESDHPVSFPPGPA